MKRVDGRSYDELRPVSITPGYQSFAEGSVLIEQGKTRLVCSVSVEDRVPPFLKGSGSGWITAEYAMLPRATTRSAQRISQGRSSAATRDTTPYRTFFASRGRPHRPGRKNPDR